MRLQQHGAGRMRRRAGIVAAPDRAAHCTAPHRARLRQRRQLRGLTEEYSRRDYTADTPENSE